MARVEALATLLPDARSSGGAIGAALVQKALGSSRPVPPRPIRVPLIASTVCRSLGVDLSDLMGRGRHKRVVLARSLVSYLARRLTSHSYPEIARALNRQNHSTIVTACQRMERAIEAGAFCDAGADLDQVTLAQLSERLRSEIVRENAQ
jgi:chromosomal replication initiator protein